MQDNKKVKDKCIRCPDKECFISTVVYYQDTPTRDEDEPIQGVFENLPEAQKWLTEFPRDVWDGFEKHGEINRELDKGEK